MAKAYISWTTDCLVLALMIFIFHEVMHAGHIHLMLHSRATRRTCATIYTPVAAAATAAVAAFFAIGMLVAFLFKVSTGYPYFISGPVHGKINGNLTQ